MDRNQSSLSERAAGVFDRAAAVIFESTSNPSDRRLAERYDRAAEYLWARVGRDMSETDACRALLLSMGYTEGEPCEHDPEEVF